MANESKPGTCAKITLGSDIILGMGAWSFTGSEYQALDDTEFCDTEEQIIRGIRTAGTITFSGNYKKDDTQGQDLIRDAYYLKSNLTDIRFWVDSVSYYTPNSTTAAGGGLPAESTISHIKIMSEPTITADKGDLLKTEVTCRLDGLMRLI